jgi:hypothetical protein
MVGIGVGGGSRRSSEEEAITMSLRMVGDFFEIF